MYQQDKNSYLKKFSGVNALSHNKFGITISFIAVTGILFVSSLKVLGIIIGILLILICCYLLNLGIITTLFYNNHFELRYLMKPNKKINFQEIRKVEFITSNIKSEENCSVSYYIDGKILVHNFYCSQKEYLTLKKHLLENGVRV